MDENLMLNLELTQSFLNILYSGYQGKHVYLNILGQLGYRQYNPGEIGETKNTLDKLGSWAQEIWQRNPLIKRLPDDKQRPEAKEIFRISKIYSGELSDISQKLKGAVKTCQKLQEKENSKLAMACLGFMSYAREHYINGLVHFYETFNFEEQADRYRQHKLHAQNSIRIVHFYLEKIKTGLINQEEGLYNRFFIDTVVMPYMFSAQVQDINMCFAAYKNRYDHSVFDMAETNAFNWEKYGIKPELASYWEAYGFMPDDAVEWINSGFNSPGYAGDWKNRDFDVRSAVQWHDAGFSPRKAHYYALKGIYDPAEAGSPDDE